MSISSQERENGNGSQNAISSDLATFRSPEDQRPAYMEATRYRECLKNHAATIGGNATDGCGEFMPGGEEGTLEALKCSACNCHRNFHRKEIQGHDHFFRYRLNTVGVGPELVGYPTTGPHQMIMPCKIRYPTSSSGDDQGVKKRFRTKFSKEQKEKMLGFAEKAGWKIQKLEESVVQQFCQEIGIKRRVLKVWMHNNKHSLAKKNALASTTT